MPPVAKRPKQYASTLHGKGVENTRPSDDDVRRKTEDYVAKFGQQPNASETDTMENLSLNSS